MSRRRTGQRDTTAESILRVADRIGTDDPVVQHLVTAALSSENPHFRRRIEKQLAALAVQHHAYPFQQQDEIGLPGSTEIDLGTTITGSAYALPEDDLTRHLLAVGKSGAGKTTLFYNIMDQLSVPFWSFDLKQDYRHLLHDHPDLLVLPWTAFKFNPLQPPDGVPPRRWAQVFGEIFGHATSLLSGSKNYLMQQVIKLYQLYDVLDEASPPYPSLLELQFLIEQDPLNYVRKSANYRDTVLNRLAAMNRTAGTVFNCSQGFPLADLLERDVVFELDGMGEDAQNFLMEVLIAAVYEYRLAQDQRGGDLRHVIFLDEGKRVFSVYKERQDAAGLPTIDALTAKMREFGEGLVVADQEASKLTDSIKANTDTKLLLSTGDAKQFREMAESMFLTDRQQELAQQVTVGEAIVQTGGRDPVPVQLAPYEITKTVTDTEIDEQVEQLSHEPRKTIPAFAEVVDLEDEETETAEDPDQSTDVSGEAERLLSNVVESPFKPLTERYDLFSSAAKGTDAKAELVDAGLVVERQVRPRQVKRKLLELTEQGRDYVEDQLDIAVDQSGRGGVVHRFWQHWIRDRFEEAGWAASVELFNADIYVNLGDTELVIEVAMGDNSREIRHVEEHLETFDVVWVTCRNEQVRDGIKQQLEERRLLDEHVAVSLFREFSDPETALIE